MRNFLLATLFFMANTAMAITPEDGWWWSPDEAGRGFNIEIQDRTIFIATFIYDGAGQPVWYTASGNLNDNNVVHATLLRQEGGQCIGCAYQAPIVAGDAGPISIQFDTRTTGTVNWQGGIVPIERFNFSLGDIRQKLLGEWALTIGDLSLGVYFGERLSFLNVQPDGEVRGFRTGPDGRRLLAATSTDQVNLIAVLDSSTSYYRIFVFNFDGHNRIVGITAVTEKHKTPEEMWDDLMSGFAFTGSRYAGATDIQRIYWGAAAAARSYREEQPSEDGSVVDESMHSMQGSASLALESSEERESIDYNEVVQGISNLLNHR